MTPNTRVTERRLTFSLELHIDGQIQMPGPAIRDMLMEAIQHYDDIYRLFAGSAVPIGDRLRLIGLSMGVDDDTFLFAPRLATSADEEEADEEPDEGFDELHDLTLRVDDTVEFLRHNQAESWRAYEAIGSQPTEKTRAAARAVFLKDLRARLADERLRRCLEL